MGCGLVKTEEYEMMNEMVIYCAGVVCGFVIREIIKTINIIRYGRR